MNLSKFLRTFALMLLASVFFVSSAKAQLIDFTDIAWKQAIYDGNTSTATIGDITLTGQYIYHYDTYSAPLTFNGSSGERAGCQAGQPDNGLLCQGDGIGIKNDEITEGGKQRIIVDFANAVNVKDILLLDLFGGEQTGEIAIINGDPYGPADADTQLAGGFYATGFSANSITQIILEGNLDYFSDYALAGIHITPVPLPGALFLFGSAMLGFLGFRRFSKKITG